jgi:hypothetical protein
MKLIAAVLAGFTHIALAASIDSAAELKKAELAVQQARVASPEQLSMRLQMLAAQRAFVGDVDGALSAFDEVDAMRPGGQQASAEDTARLRAAQEEDAIEAIVREAAKHQIVILNEAHHVPLHRAFALRLARALRRIGYSWLACETFEKIPFGSGYLSVSDGYYSREPVFGNFLRDAQRDGWQLVQYEPMDHSTAGTFEEQVERRESGEARNLVERIFARHADAKVFIYVGYSHAQEVPRVGEGPHVWMAAHLRHLTGLDPLTIDQTGMMAHTVPSVENPIYADAVQRSRRSAPFVLRSPDGGYEVFGAYRSTVDMQVVHPRYGQDADSGRPAWLRTVAGFEKVALSEDLRTGALPRFVSAYPAGQSEDAVPADVVKIEPGKPAPSFMLPRGEFHFVTRPSE